MKRLVVKPAGPEGRFLKQWQWIPERRRLENRLHGAAIQVFDAVDETTGVVAYEGIALEERRGEVHIVIRRDDAFVGFVFHRRMGVIPPAVSASEFSKNPTEILSVLRLASGIEEYETSHGLAGSPLEEVLEEMGLAVLEATSIGFVHPAPFLGGSAHELFAVVVGRKSSGRVPEANEEIDHVKFFQPEEVRGIKTICGLTKAALWSFRLWGLEQERDSLWHEVASRL